MSMNYQGNQRGGHGYREQGEHEMDMSATGGGGGGGYYQTPTSTTSSGFRQQVPGNYPPDFGSQQYGGPQQQYGQQQFNPRYGYPGQPPTPQQQFPFVPNTEQFFNNPVVANVAMQYGNQLVDTGRDMVQKELNKYVSVPLLRHYFAVDTGYVARKLKLVLFPFSHGDWMRKFDAEGPAEPRADLNCPDLYIPLMGYVTYLLVAGLALGTQDRFKPDILAICATQALAWIIIEMGIQLATIYIFNVQTNLNSFELLAFAGYKFVGIIISILLSLVFHRKGYYAGLFYTSLAIVFFLIRALKFQVMGSFETGSGYSADSSIYSSKRKMYLLLSIAITQPLFMWWLSYDFNSSV